MNASNKIYSSNKFDIYSNINIEIPIDGLRMHGLYLYSKFEKCCLFSGWRDNFKYLKYFIENGENINKRTRTSRTILMLAIESTYSNLKTIKYLIENGANIEDTDTFGSTALFYSVSSNMINNLEIVKYLIDVGANVNKKNKFGETPLMSTILNKYINLDCIKLLIRKGITINSKDNNNKTVLIYACESTHLNFDIIIYLLEQGADIYASDGHISDEFFKKSSKYLPIKNNIIKYNIFEILKKKYNKNSVEYLDIFNFKYIKNDDYIDCDINIYFK